jgi:hypothetical protein
MSCKGVVGLAAAAIVATAFCVVPADARAKKQRQYRVQTNSASLDGRVTGRARTCWHETFVYDSRGVPMGPYCH